MTNSNHWSADRLKASRRPPAWWRVLLVASALLLALVPTVVAQEPTLDEINDIARELYCPLCNGVRLDNCDLQACIQMRQVIRDRLIAGATKDQIKQEFVAQYGPVVLGEPPRRGLDLLAWILPVAALVVGLGWLFYTIRRWTQRPAATRPVPAPSQPDTPQADLEPVADDYLARVEADLAKLE